MRNTAQGIQGVVSDFTGAVGPDATVTLTSKETNVSRTATTSEGDVYTISGRSPGTFRLAVKKTGFSRKVLEEVVIRTE